MPSLFGTKNAPVPAANNAVNVEKINPQTGEILVMSNVQPLAIPDMATVTPISDVVGKNPPMMNFRDHPEFNGMKFLVMRVQLHTGMIEGRETSYAIMEGFIYPAGQAQPTEDNRVLISTGSDNIYQRVCNAFASNALPIVGTLRYAGQARFLD